MLRFSRPCSLVFSEKRELVTSWHNSGLLRLKPRKDDYRRRQWRTSFPVFDVALELVVLPRASVQNVAFIKNCWNSLYNDTTLDCFTAFLQKLYTLSRIYFVPLIIYVGKVLRKLQVFAFSRKDDTRSDSDFVQLALPAYFQSIGNSEKYNTNLSVDRKVCVYLSLLLSTLNLLLSAFLPKTIQAHTHQATVQFLVLVCAVLLIYGRIHT
jgi:hypothetical protein